MNKYLLSVITCCYNVEKFIPDYLSCLKDIDYKDVEFILINDGSTDRTKDIILDFIKKYSINKNIKFIDQKNKGYSQSKNIGLSQSQGKYVVYIDPDDFIKYDSLRLIGEALAKENPDCLCIKDKLVKENYYYRKIALNSLNYEVKNKDDLSNIFIHAMAIKDVAIGTPCVFFKKDILMSIEGYPNIFENIVSEDCVFQIKYLLLCNKILLSKQSYYFYRKRKGSILTSPFNEKFIMFMECNNRLLKDDMSANVHKYASARKCLNSICVLQKMISCKYNNKEKIKYVYSVYSTNLKYIIKCKLLNWYTRYFTFLTKPYFYIRLRAFLK